MNYIYKNGEKMKKKQVGILTYHTGYNYGASLQAFALQKTIIKMGYTCEIIHFETMRFLATREMFSRKPTRMKEMIKIVSRMPFAKQLIRRQKMFDDFTNNCLKISKLYRRESEVIEHAEDYECIVCGSDQIWNLCKNDAPAANPLFFLNFPKKQRRISYAASFGKYVKEALNQEDVFMPWLKQFDAISVREASGVEYLRSRGLECELCLDPTMLLDQEDYDEICTPPQMRYKYVLLFGWNTNEDLVNVGKRVAKQLNLTLINIVPPPRAMFKGIKRKVDVGPREFLSMIKNAEFVVTNSFHGTAFATIFEKPFVSVVSGKPDLRMQTLLCQFGLEEWLVAPDKVNVEKLLKIDYSKMRYNKAELRKSSLEYLRNALKGE